MRLLHAGFCHRCNRFIDQLKRKPIARADLEQAITEALDNHICRCTGYVRYHQAVRDLVLKTPGLLKT